MPFTIALNKIQDLNIMTKLVRFLLGITILCFLTINYFYLDNFNITTSKKIIMILLLVSGVFIYLNIVIQQIMKYLNSLYEERLLKNYYKVSSDYLELIYSKTKQMKMISHNIKDHLIMIKYFAKTDNEKLIKYLESMDKLEDISDVILIPHMEFISPILQSKIEFASRKRIKIDVKNQIRGEVLEIWDKIDIILIVSNLLDNAIEAVSNCKDEHKYIEFTIGEKMNYIYFKSINYYNYPNDNLKNKLKAVSYNFNRGNGLKIIDVIVKKYDGWWDYKIKEENIIFIVTLSKGSNKILS